MRGRGLEPPRDFSHYHLKVARLPVSPSSHEKKSIATSEYPDNFFLALFFGTKNMPLFFSVETNGFEANQKISFLSKTYFSRKIFYSRFSIENLSLHL
jgi:hypothetical protein